MSVIKDLRSQVMAGDVNDLYKAMGAVEANTLTIMADVSDMKRDMKEMVPTVTQLTAYIDKEVRPEIDGLKRARWIRHGITIGVGGVSGFGASVVAKVPAIASLFHWP